MKTKMNKHLGSNFDDFLKDEGILEECEKKAARYAFVVQFEDEMKKQHLTKGDLAKK